MLTQNMLENKTRCKSSKQTTFITESNVNKIINENHLQNLTFFKHKISYVKIPLFSKFKLLNKQPTRREKKPELSTLHRKPSIQSNRNSYGRCVFYIIHHGSCVLYVIQNVSNFLRWGLGHDWTTNVFVFILIFGWTPFRSEYSQIYILSWKALLLFRFGCYNILLSVVEFFLLIYTVNAF